MNGSRGRGRDDDDDDTGPEYDQGKRINLEQELGPQHYVRARGSPSLSKPRKRGCEAMRSRSSHAGSLLQDIYALPSFIAPDATLASQSTHHQSCSLIVVNRSAGLATGLGIRLGLTFAPADPSRSEPAYLVPFSDPGFFLPREQGYDLDRAVHLGWVEEERLADLQRIVLHECAPLRVDNPPRGGEVLEWLLEVGRRLEYEGILSNPELLLGDLLRPPR